MAIDPNFGELMYRAAARPLPVVKKPVVKKAPIVVAAVKPPVVAPPITPQMAQQLADVRQQEALSTFTRDLLAYLGNQPDKIAADYQTAIDTTDRLAQTAAEQFRLSNPNGEMQTDLGSINAPAEQRAQLEAQNRNVFGNAAAGLYQTGGQIQANMFAADQAANTAFARSLPTIQAMSAQQAMATLLGTQAKARAELEAEQAKSLGTTSKPITTKIGGSLYTLNPATGQWKLTIKAPEKTTTAKTKTTWNQKTGLILTFDANGRVINRQQVTPNPTASAKPVNGTKVTQKDGSVVLVNPRTGAVIAQVAAPGTVTKASAKKKLPSVPDFVRDAGTAAVKGVIDEWVLGRIPFDAKSKSTSAAFDSYSPAAQAKVKAAKTQYFGRAMAAVMQAIGPQLRNSGYKPADVKVAAYTIVSAMIKPPKGYKPPRATASNVSYSVPAAAQGAVEVASTQIGKPYVFGSGPDTKSFDCSDLIQYSYAQMGVKLPRTTFDQIKAGRAVKYRSPADLLPGDLIFPTRGHVVMYVGNGKVIAAPHKGELVQYQDIGRFGTPVAVRRVVEGGVSV